MVLHAHPLIRTKCRNHLKWATLVLSVLLMVHQRICGIVCRCNKLHTAFFQNFDRSKLRVRQHLIARLPDLISCLPVQETIPRSEERSEERRVGTECAD